MGDPLAEEPCCSYVPKNDERSAPTAETFAVAAVTQEVAGAEGLILKPAGQ
jgi:hypothetical protein